MTREEAKQLLPVIQAWAEGKTIEIYDRKDEEWNIMTIEDPGFDCGPSCYRIKPKPKYRPFKSQEECWQEMLKHHPFGWIKLIEKTGYSLITDVDDEILYSDAFKGCTFADGTPFGIREE